MPSHAVEILDSTLREGEQMQNISYAPSEKYTLAQTLLSEVNADRIEIASALGSDVETESVRRIADWAMTMGCIERLEVLGFTDGHKSVDWIAQTGVRTVNLLVKGSAKHLQIQLGKTPEEHFRNIEDTVNYAQDNDMTVNVYLEHFSNGITDSPDYVHDIITFLKDLGVRRIMLSDTMGILQPFDTYNIISNLVDEFPFVHFDFHSHNDYGMATANALAAARAGISGIHTTVNGLGERAGNCPLDEVVVSLRDFLNIDTQINEHNLHKVSRLVESFSGQRVSAHKPIYGSNVFVQTAGIHADGDRKGNLYHNKLTPQRFGRTQEYALGKLSGRASLDLNLEMLGISLNETQKEILLKKIIQLGERKENVTADDLPYLVSDIFDDKKHAAFRLVNCAITTTYRMKPYAAIKCAYNGEEKDGYSYGDGGYDAFMNALQVVLKEFGITMPHLVDYTVTIPPGGRTDALVQTNIVWEYSDSDDEPPHRIATRSVNSDQILAAIDATIKMINIRVKE
ncbi:MAG: hypothetical protein IKQ61_02840 [Spirochaetales bacterium]|nr:hypothetical protein [Spirochaetales bacterium]